MSAARGGCARRTSLALLVALSVCVPALAQEAADAAPSDDGAPAADEAEAGAEQGDAERAAAPVVDETPDAVLAEARERLKAGDLEQAAAMLQALRARGGLAPERLARAWLLEGMAVALLDDGEARATRAFSVALRIAPDLDPGVKQPAIREPFEAAKASLPPPAEALFAQATGRPARGGLRAGLRVELVADDLGLVAAARVGDHSPAPLSASAPLAFLPLEDEALDDGAGVEGVALLDADGNTLLRAPVSERAATAPTAPTAEDDSWFGRFKSPRWALGNWPWVTLAGTGVGGAGLLMAVGAGAFIAIYDRGLILPDSIDPVFKPALFLGLGVGVVVMLAGGAIIAADQIIRGELYKASDDDNAGADGDGDTSATAPHSFATERLGLLALEE